MKMQKIKINKIETVCAGGSRNRRQHICERSDKHPVYARGANSMPSMALPFNNYCRE